MAVALTIDRSYKLAAGMRECWGRFTPDNSWLAAGEAVAVTGLTRIDFMEPIVAGGYVFRLDVAAQKIVGYYSDNNNAADGPLIAIPDATDVTAAVGSAEAHFYGS